MWRYYVHNAMAVSFFYDTLYALIDEHNHTAWYCDFFFKIRLDVAKKNEWQTDVDCVIRMV